MSSDGQDNLATPATETSSGRVHQHSATAHSNVDRELWAATYSDLVCITAEQCAGRHYAVHSEAEQEENRK